MTTTLTRDELLNLPISAIVDGWVIKNIDMDDKLYLIIRTGPHQMTTLTLSKEK